MKNFGEIKRLADAEIRRLLKVIEEQNKMIEKTNLEKRKNEKELEHILKLFYPMVKI